MDPGRHLAVLEKLRRICFWCHQEIEIRSFVCTLCSSSGSAQTQRAMLSYWPWMAWEHNCHSVPNFTVSVRTQELLCKLSVSHWMWRKQGRVVFSKPCRFHHTGAHSRSNKAAETPRNSAGLSVYSFYFAISLATQWFIFHSLQGFWSKIWAAFTPKLCQTQNVEKIWTVSKKGHLMVLDGHTSGGDVNKSVSLSDFRAPNIFPKHTFKAKFWKLVLHCPFLFFLCLSSPQISHICFCCHVFTTAWDPSFWNVRAYWLLNIIMLSRAWSYLSCGSL